MKSSNKNARARIACAGRTLTTFGVAAALVGAVTIVPPSNPPPQRTVPAVDLTAAYLPLALQQQLHELSARAVTLPQQLNEATPAPSTRRPTFPTPPTIPPPVVTAFEFEDAIINTYHAIEPWVRYGFELGTYVVGWVPWVGWLAPQIMIFYNFGERIVESLVVNSANWLWGPLPFGEGLANVARDSWNALVQLGRDEWNFWLPPLPPLPFTDDQTADPTQDGIAGTVDESAAPSAGRPHPVRDALARLLPALDPAAPHKAQRPRWFDRIVGHPTTADAEAATPIEDPEGQPAQVDSHDGSSALTEPDRSAPDAMDPSDASPHEARSADTADDESANMGSPDTDGASHETRSDDGANSRASRTPRLRNTRDGGGNGVLNRHALRDSGGTTSD